VLAGQPGCLIPWVRPQGGVSESPDAAVAPVQPEWRCSSGRQRRSSRRARGVQLRCSVTGARSSPGRRPAGGSVQRVPRRAWQWQAGGRLRISGGGLSRIPLSLGIAFDRVGRVRPGSCGAARWRSWLRASLTLSESLGRGRVRAAQVPAGAWQWQVRGGPRILSSGVARGPFDLAGGIVRSRASLSHWAAGESMQRWPLPGPGGAGQGSAEGLVQRAGS
jgi:hypothetical protein